MTECSCMVLLMFGGQCHQYRGKSALMPAPSGWREVADERADGRLNFTRKVSDIQSSDHATVSSGEVGIVATP